MDNNFLSYDFAEAKRFWKLKFTKITGETPSFFSNPDIKNESKNPIQKTFILNPHTNSAIKKLSNNSDKLVYIIILSVLYKLSYEYYGEKCVCIGSPSTEKDEDGNALPIIVDFNEISNFKSLLLYVREQLESSNKYKICSPASVFDEEKLGFKFDNIYNLIVKHSSIHTSNEQYNKNAVLEIKNIGEDISLVWKCKADENDIDRINTSFVTILDQGLQDVTKSLEDYELITDDKERNKFLTEFQGEVQAFERKKHVVEIFEEIAKQYPQKIAIESLEENITYSEMSTYIKRLSYILNTYGVSKNDRVAILTNRTAETIIAIYSILKLGASYIPIEQDYPQERINYMLKDSGAKLLLIPRGIKEYPDFDIKKVIISLENLKDASLSRYTFLPNADSPCYVIYTSGTTGKPKGVEIKNEGLMNLCNWFRKVTYITSDSKLILLNAFGFDASVKNIFTPFMVGSTLLLGPEVLFDTEKILQMVKYYNVTHLNCVPSLFYALLDSDSQNNLQRLSSLNYVILGGEALKPKPLKLWAQSNLKADILNVYGPTECTSVTTAYKLIKDDVLQEKSIPIGKPIDNKLVYVLNKQKKLCPIQVAGELYISGTGTAENYISNSASYLNAFQSNIYQSSTIMYKTGDIVKWNERGILEFIGRNDCQVKINGHRIELSEIESVLNSYEGVKKSIVLLKDEGNAKQSLVAFITCDNNNKPKETEIKEFMKQYIPVYMVPLQILICNEFPVTVHGKTDKNKLLSIIQKSVNESMDTNNNVTETQKEIHEIWKELLGVSYVGYNENFFDVGGYSLLLYKLSKMIAERFKIDVSFVDLMTYTTINSFAEHIEKVKTSANNNIKVNDENNIQSSKRINRLQKIKEKYKKEE